MDNRFDTLAIAVAGGLSRRNAFRWLTGIVPSAIIGATLTQRVPLVSGAANGAGNKDAKKLCEQYCDHVLRHERKQCQQSCMQCNGNIQNLCGPQGALVCCSAGTVCCHSVNACGTPVSTCTDTQTDPLNCGTCGTVCVNGSCVNGACVPHCPAGQTVCGTVCTDTSRDASNCGSCGTVCPQSTMCISGQCGCAAPLTNCPGAGCVDTTTNASNCGACGIACAAGQTCVNGTCSLVSCPANQVSCNGINCCPGTTCCAGTTPMPTGTCPIPHSNGVGQTYYDCYPDGVPGTATYNVNMAMEACAAAQAVYGGTCSSGFVCATNGQAVELQGSNFCVVWVYSGPTAGHVFNNTTNPFTCLCPATTDSVWT